MSNNDNYDEERNGLWFWIPLVLILLVLFFIIRSCSNDDQLWQPSSSETASDAVNGSKNALGDALDSAKTSAGGVVGDVANKAGDAASNVAGSAENAASNAGKAASDLASGTANSVTGAAQSAGDAASGLAGGSMDAAKSAATKAGDAVSGSGKAVTGAASGALDAAGSAVSATGDAASNLGSAAVDSTGKVIDAGKSATASAAGAAVNSAQTAANSVANIPQGVLQGDVVNLLSSGKLVAGKSYPAGTLHYSSTKSEISRNDQAIIDAITQIAKANPSINIHLHGHADSSGPEKFNQYLSTQRALGAKNLLINAGVPAEQIETHGHGSNKPLASNSTPDGRLQNRRTEIEIQR
jgi:outer membrane protein OmpA-like peptidoglycan-associated protein